MIWLYNVALLLASGKTERININRQMYGVSHALYYTRNLETSYGVGHILSPLKFNLISRVQLVM